MEQRHFIELLRQLGGFFSNHFSPGKRFLEEGLFDRFGICNSTSIVYCCVEHLFVGLLKATLMEQEQ